jgi:deoxyadenosine/deoxycytidine kinase
MGRTLQPYSIQIDLVEERFNKFRRTLRREDQEIFDDLFRAARRQLQAGVMAASPNPFDSMTMSMLIELRKKYDEQSRELIKLKRDLEKLSAVIGTGDS